MNPTINLLFGEDWDNPETAKIPQSIFDFSSMNDAQKNFVINLVCGVMMIHNPEKYHSCNRLFLEWIERHK